MDSFDYRNIVFCRCYLGHFQKIIDAIEHRQLIKRQGLFTYNVAYLYILGASFWNFVGAGVFGGGTLNAPLINYYEHGYAHARSLEFYNTTLLWQWLRLPGDVVFAIGALIMAYDFFKKLGPFSPD